MPRQGCKVEIGRPFNSPALLLLVFNGERLILFSHRRGHIPRIGTHGFSEQLWRHLQVPIVAFWAICNLTLFSLPVHRHRIFTIRLSSLFLIVLDLL